MNDSCVTVKTVAMEKKNTILKILLIICIIAVVAVGCFLLYRYFFKDELEEIEDDMIFDDEEDLEDFFDEDDAEAEG